MAGVRSCRHQGHTNATFYRSLTEFLAGTCFLRPGWDYYIGDTMKTRFNGDTLLLVIEPYDQLNPPVEISVRDKLFELTFDVFSFRSEVGGWLMDENPKVRIFGADCYAQQVRLMPDVIRIRVFVP